MIDPADLLFLAGVGTLAVLAAYRVGYVRGYDDGFRCGAADLRRGRGLLRNDKR